MLSYYTEYSGKLQELTQISSRPEILSYCLPLIHIFTYGFYEVPNTWSKTASIVFISIGFAMPVLTVYNSDLQGTLM